MYNNADKLTGFDVLQPSDDAKNAGHCETDLHQHESPGADHE
jgi:hypothetical protein